VGAVGGSSRHLDGNAELATSGVRLVEIALTQIH
jgi:hypothetical protein